MNLETVIIKLIMDWISRHKTNIQMFGLSIFLYFGKSKLFCWYSDL